MDALNDCIVMENLAQVDFALNPIPFLKVIDYLDFIFFNFKPTF